MVAESTLEMLGSLEGWMNALPTVPQVDLIARSRSATERSFDREIDA
jgi:hypothetical protein